MDPIKRKRQSGNVFMEFGLLTVFVIAPIFVGTIWGGINLGRAIQINMLARDVAAMFASGVDFGDFGCVQGDVYSCQQHLAVRLAYGTNMTLTTGDAVIILSKIQKVYPQDCQLASIAEEDCTNLGLPVVFWRSVIGNDSLRSSNYGSPVYSAQTNIVPDYLSKSYAVAGDFNSLLNLEYGEQAFVVEVFLKTPDVTLSSGGHGVYSSAIF